MKQRRIALITAALFPFAFTGCAETDALPSADRTVVAETVDATTSPSAIEQLLSEGGDFRFAFEESAVYATVEAKCAEAADPQPCMAEHRRAAAGEGVEIEPIDGHRIRYASYDTDDAGERRKLLEVEATLKQVEPGIYELTDGKMLIPEGVEPPPGQRFFIEVVDAETLAMDKVPGEHPRKGRARLVFHAEP